jgi:hypothetical protein
MLFKKEKNVSKTGAAARMFSCPLARAILADANLGLPLSAAVVA